MRSRIKELFSFTGRERNGTLVLLVLVALLSGFIAVQENFVSLPDADFSRFDRFIAALNAERKNDSLAEEQDNRASAFPTVAEEAGRRSIYHTKKLFVFNPNDLPEDDWVRLGLSPAQARAVKNFEAKGGKFETKEDVKKLFVISAERYNELEPFIALPEKTDKFQKTHDQSASSATDKRQPAIVELNTADSTDLVSVDGIGPVFAKRILAYRERLGGFHSTGQLREVFGIDEERFEKISALVKTDSTYIRKINVNTAGVSDLRKHPYISPNVAQGLVNYRKQHGTFRSVTDIRSCVLVSADLYRKIAPYLTI